MKHLWRMWRRARRSLRHTERELRKIQREFPVTTGVVIGLLLLTGICDLVNMVI